MWAKSIRFPSEIRHWWLKINKEKLISGSLRGNCWQPLIAPEAQNKRACQFFSASHIGTKADCPFHHPASFLPAYVLPSPILPIAWRRFQTIKTLGWGIWWRLDLNVTTILYNFSHVFGYFVNKVLKSFDLTLRVTSGELLKSYGLGVGDASANLHFSSLQ